MSEPWEKQPGETGPAFATFRKYRDMGPARSLRKLARTGNGTTTPHQPNRYHAEWSVKNKWAERVAAYDDYLEQQYRIKLESEYFAELEDYRRQSSEMGRAGVLAAKKMLEKINAALDKMDPETIDARHIPTWIRAMADAMQKSNEVWAQSLALDKVTEILEDYDSRQDYH